MKATHNIKTGDWANLKEKKKKKKAEENIKNTFYRTGGYQTYEVRVPSIQ